MELEINRPFILYADCSVEYDGRAYSQLGRGEYLIIKKLDNSVMIHGGNKIPPRNYQGAGSKLSYSENVLTITNKKELIKITIYNNIHNSYLDNWSTQEISIIRTEADLVNKIISNISGYIADEIKEVIREYKTKLGPIDIGVVGSSHLHLIEVKRNSVSTTNVYQLKRYIDSVDQESILAYIAGPGIRDNALELCGKNNIKYIKVGF